MTMNRIIAGAAALALVAGLGARFAAAEPVVRAPAPVFDPHVAAPVETAIFAGGCFWGVQGVFAHVKGVSQAVSGYTGGKASTAQYETVSNGDTGHAESVKVTFDPRQVSYGQLLRIYFSVVTGDPTELNRQGPDEGTQYRSELFVTNPVQAKVAQAYVAQLSAAHLWKRPLVTKIAPAAGFYPAEGYHQNYLTLHPDAGYIVVNDMPKVVGLKALYPNLYRAKPAMVAG